MKRVPYGRARCDLDAGHEGDCRWPRAAGPIRLVYLAHAFGGDPANLDRAKRWLRWAAERAMRDNAFIVAPWIPLCEVFGEASAERRKFMLEGDCATVAVCSEIWLCGAAVTEGMLVELAQASRLGLKVERFAGAEPPPPC